MFAKKKELFRSDLGKPFNILKNNGETILCQSGIKDWKEELQYLKQQLSPSQKGCRDALDKAQGKKDERKLREKQREEDFREQKRKDSVKRQLMVDSDEEEADFSDLADSDDIFKVPEPKKTAKMDIIGRISNTADAGGVSLRDRTAIAASVCNAIGLNVKETNINVTSAWKSAKKMRDTRHIH